MTNHLAALVDQSLFRVEHWLREFRNPVVLWSGGKDSTAMLHLLRFKLGVNLPCVQWREPRFRHRYAHSDLLAREWDLTLYDYAPGRIAIPGMATTSRPAHPVSISSNTTNGDITAPLS